MHTYTQEYARHPVDFRDQIQVGIWQATFSASEPSHQLPKKLLKGKLAWDTPTSSRDHSELAWAKWVLKIYSLGLPNRG